MSEPVTLRIAEREFTVACEPHERAELMEAAQMLDTRMREARAGNRSAGVDRIALLVALNLTHELLQAQREERGRDDEVRHALNRLSRQLDQLMSAVAR